MPFTVTEVQPTPNPNAVKFLLDGHIAQERLSFTEAATASDHPLASRLFEIKGVTTVLLLENFITVNKDPAAKWASITPKVKKIVATTSVEIT